MRKMLATLIVVAGVFLLSASTVFAQPAPCIADLNCDGDVVGPDIPLFLSELNKRLHINGNPCLCVETNCPCWSPVPKTGQITTWATGDDGDLQKGLPWPNPRFTDNGDGTVTDNLTKLIWLKDANCFGTRIWQDALSECNGLADPSCGLTDGSNSGDWRLPNRRELFSLIHDEYTSSALPDTAGTGQWSQDDPFNNVQDLTYWSSTSHAGSTPLDIVPWWVSMHNGVVNHSRDSDFYYVWPVRDPL